MRDQKKIGAILSYVNIFVGNTVSLLYTPFALRILGQSQYGLFGTASSLTGYLSLLSLGIGGAYIRWNVRYRTKGDVEGEKRLNGMYFTMFSVISALVLLIGFVLLFLSNFIYGKSFTSDELHDLKWIILINIIYTSLTMFFTPVLMNILAYEKFLVNKALGLIGSLITPAIKTSLV